MTDDRNQTPLIELRSISKYFGNVIALQDVSMTVYPGEVMCLLGDNGAGKSTLIKCLSGVHQPDEGEMLVDGEPVRFTSPREALEHGIATVYQDLAMIPLMSIARNFFLGSEPTVGWGPLRRFDVEKADRVTREELRRMGIDVRDTSQPVGTLSGGERQSVAIARAVHFGARLLILDEPTSALGVKEAGIVLKYVDQARRRGVGVVFITHNIHHAFPIGDRFTILNRGRSYGTFEKSEITRDDMLTMMAGGEELEQLGSELSGDRPSIHIGNAPCSWGSLEFEGIPDRQVGYEQMLDELVETGYRGTELGDWGYMPSEPAVLREELLRRGLTMLGAFVPVAFARASAHADGERRALRIARLLSAVADVGDPDHRPFLVLADDNGSDPDRTRHAGRVTPEMMLDDVTWDTFAAGAERVARSVLEDTGLRSVFHHHCAGYVETPAEIEKLLERTDPDVLGLVFDTGHYAFGAGDCDLVEDGLDRFGDRIHYVHFKDCSAEVAARSRTEKWDYFASLQHGIFCELGDGCVDFPRITERLRALGYSGWIVVEQDVLPGMGAPRESAARNRAYLRKIGL